jgi:arsenite methyltransferase
MRSREYYGLDAPTVVRNLVLVGAALLGISLLTPRNFRHFSFNLFVPGVALLSTAAWMVISSLWLKKYVMRSLLAEHRWCRDELVLDVGCGRGLVTVEAARRVPEGRVHAIDLWQSNDLSGNSPESLAINATIAGVIDRLTVDTGDARRLPYANGSFDLVTSMSAIHNIPDRQGRQEAVSEMWRVTKPGGQLLIFDIFHARSYFYRLRELGVADIRLSGPIFLWALPGWRISAVKQTSVRNPSCDRSASSNGLAVRGAA